MADHDPVTMRDLENLEKLMLSRFTSAETATKLASEALGQRLEHMNEFREEIKDYTARLMPRDECTLKSGSCSKSVNIKLDDLMEFKNQLKGKASQNSVAFAIIIALIGAGGTLINMFK